MSEQAREERDVWDLFYEAMGQDHAIYLRAAQREGFASVEEWSCAHDVAEFQAQFRKRYPNYKGKLPELPEGWLNFEEER
ncbi:MAG: hypothetical protein E6I27_16050 [Chloroflexi bacterium]|nr:MAG: hypothetical protein E6I27_16050 [Chloroflexota bacterium]